MLKEIRSQERVNRLNSGLELYTYPCGGKLGTNGEVSAGNKWGKLQFVAYACWDVKRLCVALLNQWDQNDCCVWGCLRRMDIAQQGSKMYLENPVLL